MSKFAESTVEIAALEWLGDLGYSVAAGPDLLDGLFAERPSASTVILGKRLAAALARINPNVPQAALAEAQRNLLNVDAVLAVDRNHRFHHAVVNGVAVEYPKGDGSIAYTNVAIVDFEHPDRNDWLAVNQFTVVDGRHHRRPDIVLFLNGFPVALIELKNAADEDADLPGAFQQIQTYKAEIPAIFDCNEICVISDGTHARSGSLTSDWERFMPWRTTEGDDLAARTIPELQVTLEGIFEKRRFLDLLRYFIVFEDDGDTKIKKIAGYHQYHAVRKAVEATVEASGVRGDRRAGVVWHTQGSGKSITMAFYA